MKCNKISIALHGLTRTTSEIVGSSQFLSIKTVATNNCWELCNTYELIAWLIGV